MRAGGNPDHWDLHQSCCNAGPGAARDLFNALVRYDPVMTSEIIGDLAESWDVGDDGLSYTFRLKDANWTDGQPVTAGDAKFSLDRMIEDGKPRPRPGALRPFIKDVEVIDSKTVKVNVEFPFPAAFMSYMAIDYTMIYPEHVLGGRADSEEFFDDPANIVGSGSMKFKSLQRDVDWEFEKNPDYFKEGLPFLDGTKAIVIKGIDTVIAAFETEQVYMCNRMSGCSLGTQGLINLEEAMKGKGEMFYTARLNAGLNFNYTKPPFDKPEVRQAVSLAIDRLEILDVIDFGSGIIGTPFFPGTWMSSTLEDVYTWEGFRYVDAAGNPIADPAGRADRKKDPRDIEKAKELLAQAGYADGLDIPFTCGYEEWCLLTKQQLEPVGINVDVQIETSLAAKEASGDYILSARRHGASVIEPDDMFLCCYMPGGPRNQLDWEDPRITAIFDRQKQEPDQEKRKAMIKEAEDILRTGVSAFMHVWWSGSMAQMVNNKVKNYHRPMTLHQALSHESLWLE
jgi:ABC-type transport system substrate-binding protein